jgi:hypothetical protein
MNTHLGGPMPAFFLCFFLRQLRQMRQLGQLVFLGASKVFIVEQA